MVSIDLIIHLCFQVLGFFLEPVYSADFGVIERSKINDPAAPGLLLHLEAAQ